MVVTNASVRSQGLVAALAAAAAVEAVDQGLTGEACFEGTSHCTAMAPVSVVGAAPVADSRKRAGAPSAASGRLLVVAHRASAHTLDSLLVHGQAATVPIPSDVLYAVCASLVRTIAACHTSGVAHCGLSLEALRVVPSGAVSVDCWALGRAVSVPQRKSSRSSKPWFERVAEHARHPSPEVMLQDGYSKCHEAAASPRFGAAPTPAASAGVHSPVWLPGAPAATVSAPGHHAAARLDCTSSSSSSSSSSESMLFAEPLSADSSDSATSLTACAVQGSFSVTKAPARQSHCSSASSSSSAPVSPMGSWGRHSRTSAGASAGTAAATAPAAAPRPPLPREDLSDAYSLGCTLMSLLTHASARDASHAHRIVPPRRPFHADGAAPNASSARARRSSAVAGPGSALSRSLPSSHGARIRHMSDASNAPSNAPMLQPVATDGAAASGSRHGRDESLWYLRCLGPAPLECRERLLESGTSGGNGLLELRGLVTALCHHDPAERLTPLQLMRDQHDYRRMVERPRDSSGAAAGPSPSEWPQWRRNAAAAMMAGLDVHRVPIAQRWLASRLAERLSAATPTGRAVARASAGRTPPARARPSSRSPPPMVALPPLSGSAGPARASTPRPSPPRRHDAATGLAVGGFSPPLPTGYPAGALTAQSLALVGSGAPPSAGFPFP